MAKGKVKTKVRRVYVAARRRAAKMTIPIAVVAGIGVPAGRLFNDWQKYHDVNIITREIGQFMTGFDWTTGQWSWQPMKYGALPIAVGMFVHKFVGGKLGVNAALSRAKIPLLRL